MPKRVDCGHMRGPDQSLGPQPRPRSAWLVALVLGVPLVLLTLLALALTVVVLLGLWGASLAWGLIVRPFRRR